MGAVDEWGLTWTSTLEGWNRYAAVNDEFVDIHMSDEAARSAGLPGAIGMGNLRIGYLDPLLDVVVRSVSADGQEMPHVSDLTCRFTAFSVLGDRLTAWARLGDERPAGIEVALGVRASTGVETTPAVAHIDRTGSGSTEPIGVGASRAVREVAREVGLEHLLGVETTPVRSWPVSVNDARRWRLAIGFGCVDDLRETWLSDDRVPRLLNPFAWNPGYRPDRYPWMLPIGKAPGSRVLNGGLRIDLGTPLGAGDEVTSVAQLVDCEVKVGSLGRMLLLRDRELWRLPTGQFTRAVTRTTIYY